MAIRISGIVRVARTTQQRLQQGIHPDDRERFLREIGDHVRQIEMICDEHSASPEELPAPSRRAYALLLDTLTKAPEALPLPEAPLPEAPLPEAPLPGAHAPAPAVVRVTRIVSALDRILAQLGVRPGGEASVEAARIDARARVERVRELCEAQGATPAALPVRSGRAFSMLAWLGEDDHAQRYVAQHELACGTLEPVVLEHFPRVSLRLTFEPGRHIYAMRRRGPLARFKLSVAYLAATESDFRDLAAVCVPGVTPTVEARQRHDAFIASPPATALQAALRTLWKGTSDRPAGHAYDLDVLFQRLNERYFEGAMSRPRLEWRASLSSSRFGYHKAASDLIVIDARLDDSRVPEFVAECVLFHEMLHKHYGTPHRNGRRQIHPPHFRRHERLHPHFAESERWLEALVQAAEEGREYPAPPR